MVSLTRESEVGLKLNDDDLYPRILEGPFGGWLEVTIILNNIHPLIGLIFFEDS
jgi:hypothetical protein